MNTYLIVALALAASAESAADEPRAVQAAPGETVKMVSAEEIAGQCRFDAARQKSASGPWQEGVDYRKLDPLQQTSSGPKVEVLEFFAYWCPQCSSLEPKIADWVRSGAKDVVLKQVPLILANEYSRRYAALYYTFIELGRTDLHDEFFEAIVRSRRAGDGNLLRPEAQRAFAISSGVAAAQFDRVIQSPEVAAEVERAEELARAYEVTSAPTIAVQGAYRIEKNPERSLDDLLRLADVLVDRVRDDRQPHARETP